MPTVWPRHVRPHLRAREWTRWGAGHGLARRVWIDVLPGFRVCLGHDMTDKAPRAKMHTAMTAMATKYPLAALRPAL